jgi:hypothetical protein
VKGSTHAVAFAVFGLIVVGLSLDAIARVSTDIGCTRYRECDVRVLPDMSALLSQIGASLTLLVALLVVVNAGVRFQQLARSRRRWIGDYATDTEPPI